MEWHVVAIRLIFSVFIGLLVGYEREKHGHPAGVKTHIMVCMGAAVVSLMQLYIKIDNPDTDITRIIAQVVSGVGFLGAGCILHDRGNGTISGLTTAATLWLTACLGLAAGLGFYKICILSCVLVTIIMYLFGKISGKKQKDNLTKTKK